MRDEWSADDVVDAWTLVEEDWRLIGRKSGSSRLGFALLLKSFEAEGRFPRGPEEFPEQVVAYVARQVRVGAQVFGAYEWMGRSAVRHRAEIRAAFGFREFTRADEDAYAAWLAGEVCPFEAREPAMRDALLAKCRSDRVEPPGRVERIVGSACASFESAFTAEIQSRLGAAVSGRLEALVADPDGRQLLAALKQDPGQVGLETLLREIGKLDAVRTLGLPVGLFTGVSDSVVKAWRARASRCYPSDLAAVSAPVRLTLLAALCWSRSAEITDALVDLLIALVLKVNTRADRRVEREMTAELRRVRGKEGILFRLAEAAVEHPDDTVRAVVFPVVGERTLRDLVAEARANEAAFQARVRTVLRSSYSNHYRRMLPPLLSALKMRCHNPANAAVIDALAMLERYTGVDGKVRYYADGEVVPIEGVVPKGWRDAVIDDRGRVERIPYELCVLVTLRDAIRRREVFVRAGNGCTGAWLLRR